MSGVTVSRGNNTLTASWNAPARADHYHVTYSLNGTGWTLAAYEHPANSITMAADNAATYVVGVRAGNAAGWSGWRNSPVSEPNGSNPPANPPGPVASIALSRSGNTLTASWHTVADADHYHVTYSDNNGAGWSLAAYQHPAPVINIAIDPTKTYIVGVRAGNAGGWSGWRNSSPSQPVGVDAPASATLAHNGATLAASWDAVTGATGYNVELRDAAAGSWLPRLVNVSGTSATVTTPSRTNSYQIRVQALGGGGASPWTESAVAHNATSVPAAPYWVNISRTSFDHVQATWSAVQNAGGGYTVQYSDDNRATWTTWKTGFAEATDQMHLDARANDAGQTYVVRVRASNDIGAGQWQYSANLPAPTFTAEGFLDYAILRLSNYDGQWRYQANLGPHASCQPAVTGDNKLVAGLSYAAAYTYAVYDAGGCDGDAIAPAASFTTLTPLNFLTVSNVQSTTATLNMDRQYAYTTWYYSRMGGGADEQCVRVAGNSVNLTGLTDKTFYDYVAYHSPWCLWSQKVDRTYFTTTDAGAGNLTSSLDGGCSFGRRNSATDGQSCAAAFTTGTNPDGGYFLHFVTVRLEREVGYAGPVTATLHSADADGKPAPAVLATLTGTTQQAAGAYRFSCEGSGVCNLSNATKYFIVLSAPNAANYYYRDWQTRNSGQEYQWPATAGWNVHPGAMRKAGAGDWTVQASGKTPVLHLAANHTSAGLRASLITATGATLHISGHTGNWYIKDDQGAIDNCRNAGAGSRIATGTLAPGAYYVYTAYSDSACNTALASAAFTTAATALNVSNIEDDRATLTLAGHSGNWHYKATSGPHTSCSSAQTGTTATVTGLSPTTNYTYSAYSDSGCNTLIVAASAFRTLAAVSATLAATNITHNAATLGISGYSGNWWYDADKNPYTACRSAGSVSSASLSGLSGNTSYTFKAYDKSGCNSADEIGSKTFSTNTAPTLTSSGVTHNGATLTIANHIGNWYYKATTGPDTSCSTAQSGSTATISSLSPGTAYTYSAYSDSGCTTLLVTAAAFTTLAPTLTSSSITTTGATLTIGTYTGSWYYKANAAPHTACSGEQSGTTATLTGLTPGATYTYSAYSDSTCTDANKLATASAFTTPGLTVSQITDTTATLTLVGNTANWYYKADTGPDSSCSSTALSGTTTTKALTGLTAGTTYTYTAYSDSSCTTMVATASAFTTSDVTVSNLSETASSSNCAVGNWVGSTITCAAPFTTGTSTNGYTLNSITAKFNNKTGNPSGFNVALHLPRPSDPTNAVKQTPIGDATFSGSAPDTAGDYTYGCSGSGCDLSANSTYYVVISVSSATDGNYYLWRSTSSNDETKSPSNNGWSIDDRRKDGLGSGWVEAAAMFKVSATRKPVPPTLTSSSISTTGATLNFTGNDHTGSWYYQADAGPDASACSSEQTGTTKTLTGLTPGTSYTYAAYSDSGCTDANKLATAAAFTTTGVSVSNLGQSIVNYCAVGGANINSQRCATAFTTGSNSGGYTLHSVTGKFRAKAGSPGTFSVALHADSSGNPATSAVANATFSGSAPETAGDHTFTCSGTGCSLSASTTYHVVMSATADSGTNQFRWETTTSDSETNTPSGSGWSIANDGKRGNAANTTWLGLPTQSTIFKVAATVN